MRRLILIVLCVVLVSYLLISCKDTNSIIVENLIGELKSSDLEYYSYKRTTEQQMFKIKPNGSEVEVYYNADGFISLDVLNLLADIYTNGNIDDLYSEFGQPIVFYPKNKLAIFDGWSCSNNKFTILSSKKNEVYDVEKSDFEELLIHTYETDNSIFFYSFLIMYEFNTETKEFVKTDYLYPPNEFINEKSYIDKDEFIITDDMVISIISYINLTNEVSDKNGKKKSILYTSSKINDSMFNYVEIDEDCISIFYFDNHIYLLSFSHNSLYMSKYDKNLNILLKEQLNIPQDTFNKFFLDIHSTTFQNENKIILSCKLISSENSIFVMQYDLKEFSVDFAAIVMAPKEYYLTEANFIYE